MIINLADENSNMIEIGCGTGDLLFRATGKIRSGLGVDSDKSMIDFANKRKQKEGYENLEFINEDIACLEKLPVKHFDISTSTLCLHEMSEERAVCTLELLAKYSSRIIIADFSAPKTHWGKISIELDEIVSGHYEKFKHYRKRGGIPYLAKMACLKICSTIETPIDGIHIWELSGDKCV